MSVNSFNSKICMEFLWTKTERDGIFRTFSMLWSLFNPQMKTVKTMSNRPHATFYKLSWILSKQRHAQINMDATIIEKKATDNRIECHGIGIVTKWNKFLYEKNEIIKNTLTNAFYLMRILCSPARRRISFYVCASCICECDVRLSMCLPYTSAHLLTHSIAL